MAKKPDNLGDLHCWINTNDPAGNHIHWVKLSDCWNSNGGYVHKDQVLAKAVDGALRKFFLLFDQDAETVVADYSCTSGLRDGVCDYQVTIRLNGETELKASAPSEVLAVFAALWRHYKSQRPGDNIILMGNLRVQIDSLCA